MTNKEKWDLLMKDVESPDIFLDTGFLFLISSALQRRVWIPFGTNNLYPNLYIIFVAPPGAGKGRVITQVNHLIKQPKRLVSDFTQGDYQLFATLPDSTSLRSLTSSMAKSFRVIKYKVNGTEKVYGHSSMAFILEELSDLFKDQSETKDLCRFLTRAWDCGDFRHETYHNGKDEIKLMCVNLLAGTTLDGMKDFFNTKVLNEGFSSRVLFVWAEKNRFYKWAVGNLTEEQEKVRNELVQYLIKLSNLCGEVILNKEADEWMKDWYENKSMLPRYRVNHNYRLDHYYGRKKMHLLKLAISFHFSEKTTMVLEKEDIEKAYNLLESIEKHMHIALTSRGRNDLYPVSKVMYLYLKKFGPLTATQLYVEFAEDLKDKLELNQILALLQESRQITSTRNDKGEIAYKAL